MFSLSYVLVFVFGGVAGIAASAVFLCLMFMAIDDEVDSKRRSDRTQISRFTLDEREKDLRYH